MSWSAVGSRSPEISCTSARRINTIPRITMRRLSLTRLLTAILLTPAIWIGVRASYQVPPAIVGFPQVATSPKPSTAPARWRPLIGEYVRDRETVIILEKDGKLCVLFKRTELAPLRELKSDSFEFDGSTSSKGERVLFSRDGRGRVTRVALGKVLFNRKPLG